jgi:hypothetical protein
VLNRLDPGKYLSLANSGVAHVSVVQSGASSPLGFCLRCSAVDADQAVNAGMASLTCCQLSTSIHRLALRPAGCCSQLWWIRGLSAWIAPPFILGPTLETIKIRTDNDLLQRAALGRSLAKSHQFLAHTHITNIFALEAGSLRKSYT